jgi:hypothetical protein
LKGEITNEIPQLLGLSQNSHTQIIVLDLLDTLLSSSSWHTGGRGGNEINEFEQNSDLIIVVIDTMINLYERDFVILSSEEYCVAMDNNNNNNSSLTSRFDNSVHMIIKICGERIKRNETNRKSKLQLKIR